jgi:hypothetical protein
MAAPLLVWPLALVGTAAAIALSTSGLLSLVAAHAGAPPAVHARATMPAPRLASAMPSPSVVAPSVVAAVGPRPAIEAPTVTLRVSLAGAVMRGAAGAGALAVWQLRPGTPVVVLANRADWSEVDQQGLVGWVPTSALISD